MESKPNGKDSDAPVKIQDSTEAEIPTSELEIIDNTPNRSSWQNPNLVINRMGDLEGKVVADIGADVGYFAFRLILKKAKVIAVDIDPESIQRMDDFALNNLNREQRNRFETRLAEAMDPYLSKNEIDMAILMNIINYFEDKKAYLGSLKESIKPGGSIMIMDAKMKRLPEVLEFPPKENRIYAAVIEELLYELGYVDIVVDDTTLDYQYIITATNAK